VRVLPCEYEHGVVGCAGLGERAHVGVVCPLAGEDPMVMVKVHCNISNDCVGCGGG
jgi:hypothetical protein